MLLIRNEFREAYGHYGLAAVNCIRELNKKHYEDPQDISKIVNDLEARALKLPTEQSDKQSPIKSS